MALEAARHKRAAGWRRGRAVVLALLASATGLLAPLRLLVCGDQPGAWQVGRATFFGSDSWSIHAGSCGYGYIFPDEPLGWSVAALPDVDSAYMNSCGQCLEVMCQPGVVKDGYGASFDRTSACLNPGASVVVRVTDTCPCTFAPNQYSNKRWCCGDAKHVELSVWAWERLADKKWGVVSINYRHVPCDFTPAQVAPPAANPTPAPASDPSPPSARPARDWPEFWPLTASPVSIYQGGLQAPWVDASSGLRKGGAPTRAAIGGSGAAMCAQLDPDGAFAVVLPGNVAGAFGGRTQLVVWLYVGPRQGSDAAALTRRTFSVILSGPTSKCKAINLKDVRSTGLRPACATCNDYWWRLKVFLSAFAASGATPVTTAIPATFTGCGDDDAPSISRLEIRNPQGRPAELCLDGLELL